MATGEAATDKWRDEDGMPSPQEELGDWWLDTRWLPPEQEMREVTASYLQELYDEIRELRERVRELEAAPRRGGRGAA